MRHHPVVAATDQPGTWHHGIVARYWAEFNEATDAELAYLRAAIARSGEPVLDVGCGAGRLLLPLLADGMDIDGSDLSRDMLAYARAGAERLGRHPRLEPQANHELDLPRRYRTVFAIGAFGIGGRRDRDLAMLDRIHAQLEDGGTLLMDQELATARSEEAWLRWLPGHQGWTPRAFEDRPRRRTADGDEIELDTRLATFDPVAARHTLHIRARLYRDGGLVAEEIGELSECLYLVLEIRLMLETTGFRDVRVEGPFTGEPATARDTTVVFVARR
jgi:SAM-dependent methyltransferase